MLRHSTSAFTVVYGSTSPFTVLRHSTSAFAVVYGSTSPFTMLRHNTSAFTVVYGSTSPFTMLRHSTSTFRIPSYRLQCINIVPVINLKKTAAVFQEPWIQTSITFWHRVCYDGTIVNKIMRCLLFLATCNKQWIVASAFA
jgi:hypothetical protein